MVEKVVMASPRGFCAGVVRAIDVVKIALDVFPKPIYVRKEIVHNLHVVEELRGRGAIFVEELDEVPSGKTVIFSAHGVSPSVRQDAQRRGLNVIDATCPLVTKVHLEAKRYAKNGYGIVLIGHRGHDEVIGTMGVAPENIHLVTSLEDIEKLDPASSKLAYITQTTLSVEDTREIIAGLRRKFPHIEGPPADDICYATQNRQDAVKFMTPNCEVVIVVGSPNSSNSNRLREVAENMGAQAHMVDTAADLRAEWIAGARRVGVTAGASAPEVLVEEVVARLKALGAASVRQLDGITERVVFTLPRELARR